MQLPEATKTLCQQLGIKEVSTVASALQAMTALGNGDGQILTWHEDAFVTLLTAQRGEWDECSIGRTVTKEDEIFAYQAWHKRRVVFAPLGLVRGVEPIAHCAAFITDIPVVLTLDLPLAEVRFIPAWQFPRRLLRHIARAAWGSTVPTDLLPWTLRGRSGVLFWDANGRLRWHTIHLSSLIPNPSSLDLGLTISGEFVALRTPAGTVMRRRQSAPSFLQGYALLRSEVHHRVKNDLQSVISWLRLQARNTPTEEAKATLLEAADRVRAFATVHDLLARERGEFVALRELAQQLAHVVTQQAQSEGKQVRYIVVGPEARLSPKQASALAPALHELLRNACEHAFDSGKGGTITVRIQVEDTHWCVEVADDGKGFDPQTLNGTTLGLTIARNLVEQDLGGVMDIRSTAGCGTVICLRFPR